MSREVIGTGTTEEAERRPAPRAASRAATVTDLDGSPDAGPVAADDTGHPGDGHTRDPGYGHTEDPRPRAVALHRPTRWPDTAPSWLAAPVGIVGAVVVGLLAGALLGTGVAERSAAQQRSEAVRLVGGLAYPNSGFLSSSTGGSQIDVLVINAGPETVRVTGASFGTGAENPIELSEPFEVAPGESVRERAEVQVDCDRPARSDVSEVSVTAVTPDGRARDVVLADSGMGGILATRDLGYLCGDFDGSNTLDVFSTISRGDGALSMQVRNSTPDAVELTFLGPAGVTIVGEPPFPLEVRPNSSEFLVVRVQIDECTGAATRADAGNDLRLLVDDEREQAFLDPVVTAGWLAREVALACPAG